MSVTKEAFGSEYTLYTIQNQNGTVAKVTDLGGTLVSLLFQDKNEVMRDVVLGYDTPEEYVKNDFFFGAWVGRSGNRIAQAKFELNGRSFSLTVNDNENNLHSGMDFFHLRRANVTAVTEDSVTFEIVDKDLQQGYPGNFTAQLTYTLTEDDVLRLKYSAVCDQDRVGCSEALFHPAGEVHPLLDQDDRVRTGLLGGLYQFEDEGGIAGRRHSQRHSRPFPD